MSWRGPASGERRPARASIGSIDARDRFRWNDVLVNVAPGKDDEGCVGTQCCDAQHPPDVPDHSETHDGREEGADEAGWTVPWHFNISIHGLPAEPCLLKYPLLHSPVGFLALDVGEHREVEGRRRGGGRPFEGASIPRIADLVAKLLTSANADDELRDLQDYSDKDDRGADGRDQQPRMPGRNIIVLHAASHSHEAEDVKRHESDVEACDPAPERRLAKPFVQPEAKRLREPIGVAGERAEEEPADDDVVEVGHEEKAVVKHEVHRGGREEDAGQY